MNHRYELSEQVLTINFTSGESIFPVHYQLYKNSAAAKWFVLMQKTLLLGHKIIDNGIFFGNGVVDQQKIKEQLAKNVIVHNDFCQKNDLNSEMIPITIDNPATQERLNLLHEYFEKYAEDPRFLKDTVACENLQFLNLNIHRLESCLYGADSSHVEVINLPKMTIPIAETEYKLFTPDFIWGELYLTYGMTGVPTLNAFHMKSDPTPQNVITNGFMLGFWPDNTFQETSEMNAFLKEKGIEQDDPRKAIGYIPLGVILDVEKTDKKEVLNSIKMHAQIKDFSFHNLKDIERAEDISDGTINTSEANWPYDPEVFYHLDLVPYIDLKITFDAKKLLAEAEKAIGYFVGHRDYDQESNQSYGKWKSLALRGLFGDYKKTQYHTSYEFEGKAIYQNTIFAELCPETMKFLETVTDISQCERVRFMLLEPGASIKTHRDSQDRDVCLAVNISLNMPDECIFYSQLNSDGTENPFTVQLPFKDSGSVLLFNNAKYHRVVNNSQTPRIHIIFHGPVRFSDKELIQFARAQNKIDDSQELIRRVVYKKNFIGEELTKTKSLMTDWQVTGLRDTSLPANYALAVYDHSQYFSSGNQSDFYLRKRTSPTLFPLSYEVIKENECDDFIQKSYESGKEFAVILAAGTFFKNLHSFIKETVAQAIVLKKLNWPAAGHLMDFNDGEFLPYFHEQFIIINLKVWHELGAVGLGGLYQDAQDEIKNIIASEEKIHDNYTPHFIKGGESSDFRKGKVAWGSQLIKKAVLAGRGVLNLSNELRNEKVYSYPRDEIKKPKELVEALVSERLNHSKNEVFYFNNEPLTVLKIPGLRPNKIISVAAGIKPFQIVHQYKVGNDAEIHFVDFSTNALKYIKEVIKANDFYSLCEKIISVVKRDPVKKDLSSQVEAQLNGIVRSYFSDSKDNLLNAIKVCSSARFNEIDLIKDKNSLSSLVGTNDQFVIWVSNAFYNNSLYLLLTKEEAEMGLLEHARAIGRKCGLKAFKHNYGHSIVFGKNLNEIQGVLTDGALMNSDFEAWEWKELT